MLIYNMIESRRLDEADKALSIYAEGEYTSTSIENKAYFHYLRAKMLYHRGNKEDSREDLGKVLWMEK